MKIREKLFFLISKCEICFKYWGVEKEIKIYQIFSINVVIILQSRARCLKIWNNKPGLHKIWAFFEIKSKVCIIFAVYLLHWDILHTEFLSSCQEKNCNAKFHL